MSRPVVVEIYESNYTLRGVEPDLARRLASEVDRRMRAIAGDPAGADTGKVAILAALNLADDLQRLREDSLSLAERAGARAAELVSRIDMVLATTEQDASR